MTNQQGAPEALRLAEEFERDGWIAGTKQWCAEASAELRRLHTENERLATLVEAQQPATHVQKPAGIEHVAGDVSKNGAESNMAQQAACGNTPYDEGPFTLAQQPAPSAAAATEVENLRKALQFYADKDHFRIADDGAWDTVSGEPQNYWCDEEGTATVEDGTIARLALAGHQIKFDADAAPQPSPTPQADSQPAPVAGGYPAPPGREVPSYSRDGLRLVRDSELRAYVDADRAASATADSVTAPAGGVVAGPNRFERTSAVLARMQQQEDGHAANPFLPLLQRLIANEGSYSVGEILQLQYALDGFYGATPTPPAQAADSVLEDAARLDWLALAGPTSICLVIDRPHDGEIEVATDDVIGYGKTLREALDAARSQAKEGA